MSGKDQLHVFDSMTIIDLGKQLVVSNSCVCFEVHVFIICEVKCNMFGVTAHAG